MDKKEICERFALSDGKFFAEYMFKNLRWFLNDTEFGFGDIREEDVARIKGLLEEGEKFEGFNEHHMTEWMQRENPVITINSTSIIVHTSVPVSQETRNRIKEERGL